MYRGRPPPRGGYPPPFEGRAPHSARPYLVPGYRDERGRPPYHSDYRDHGAPEPYRDSPSRRRYPSPGAGGHRGGEYWAGGPLPERSPHRAPDQNLVITVGNKLTGPPGPTPPHPHDRERHSRPEYRQSRSGGRSSAEPGRGRSKSRHRGGSRSPDRTRTGSRGRSKSRHRGQNRSPDHNRGRSQSPDRSRAKSRGRSRSRPRGPSRSPGRSRAKSRGRSKSTDRSRARSRGRSKSRPHSRSRSRSRSRGRSRRSRSRSSRSCSSSSSSSRSSSREQEEQPKEVFKELEMARRRKELEELMTQPTKSILKKRNSYEDSPSIRSAGSPQDPALTMARVAEQLLQAVKVNDPQAVASVLSDLQSDPVLAQRAGLDSEIQEILSLLGVTTPESSEQHKVLDEIDDEEKFLYGDSEEPKSSSAPEPVHHHSLDLYGDVTDDLLYGEPAQQRPVSTQSYDCHPTAAVLQAPPSAGEVSRYLSRPNVEPDLNFTVHVSNPECPPGTEPLEDSERQALEEYAKIEGLLKTIGLDLGVAEIGKMAARTKERLQGHKPPPKTPTRRCRYSSGSSESSHPDKGHRGRSQSSSSSSRSRSAGRGPKRGPSWSSEAEEDKKECTRLKAQKGSDTKKGSEWSSTAPPQTPDSAPVPALSAVPIPSYPPPQLHGMMPPSFPPPGYGQFGSYLHYMHQQWPPMYPPPQSGTDSYATPNVAPPPQSGTERYPVPSVAPPTHKQSALAAEATGVLRTGSQGEQRSSKNTMGCDELNESEKQKVLEEREKLKEDRMLRMTKKEYLIKELERLRKQQGELLRKKRREKDGHKDPLLQELSQLQEEVMAQISSLLKEHEAAEKKRREIEAVALILGLTPSDRPNRTRKQPKVEKNEAPASKKISQVERSPEPQLAVRCSSGKPTAPVKLSPEEPPVPALALTPPPDPFEYYDAGNHWCQNCNVTSGSMFDFFTHLHSKAHRKTLDPYDRPWASDPAKISKTLPAEQKLTKPAKGSEFLVPVRGFFCLLCKKFYGDAICAEEHVITHAHNETYKKRMYENPLYEQRRNLDRQAGLVLEMGSRKRKYEEEDKGSKEREEKTKAKKEKKEKKRDETTVVPKDEKGKVKKEDEGDKVKTSRKEEGKSFSNKDVEEKPKHGQKDCGYGREEDRNSRYRSSRREEEPHYRFHREDDARYPDWLKYASKGDEDKGKHSKYSDLRSKYDKEREDGRAKAGKEAEKPAASANVSKAAPPPKPHEPPKIFSGPSPAMRAKLRKQALEAGKAPAAATKNTGTSFGKFTWKKKESQLAKDAQKVAAEFMREDEKAVNEQSLSVEDSFSKSIAAAKDITEQLAGEALKPPPWYYGGRGQIRPNLRAPAAQQRRPTLVGKPASLNSFLNMRPQGVGPLGTPPRNFIRPQNPQGAPFQRPSAPLVTYPMSAPAFSDQETFGPSLPPSMSKSQTLNPPTKSEPTASRPEATQDATFVKPATIDSNPVTVDPKPASVDPKPTTVVHKPAAVDAVLAKSNPVNLEAKPAALQVSTPQALSKPLPVEVKVAPSEKESLGRTPTLVTKDIPAQPAMIKVVSDTAAPGVPESEQTQTVFVKPPPFMKMTEATPKTGKLKSNLAAAKAQDLFGIFYSSGKPGSSSFSKLELDNKNDQSTKSPSLAPLIETQAEHQKKPQSQKSEEKLQSLPTRDINKPQPGDQLQTKSQMQTQPHLGDEPQTKPRPGDEPQTQPQPRDEPQTQPQPRDELQTQPQPRDQPQAPPQPRDEPQAQQQPGDEPQAQQQPGDEPQAQQQPGDEPRAKPQMQTRAHPKEELQTQPQRKDVPQTQPHPREESQPQDKLLSEPEEFLPLEKNATLLPVEPQTPPKLLMLPETHPSLVTLEPPPAAPSPQESNRSLSSIQPQLESGIQITSVWSLQTANPPVVDGRPSETSGPIMPQSLDQILVRPSPPPEDQEEESQTLATIRLQEEPSPQPDQDVPPPPENQAKPRASPRSRGKSTPTKKTPRASVPARQTRSQTRYRTRQQQAQIEPPEEDSAAPDSKGSDQASSPKGELAGDPCPSEMDITAETLGLPTDIISLDFDYDFNFE